MTVAEGAATAGAAGGGATCSDMDRIYPDSGDLDRLLSVDLPHQTVAKE